MKKILPNPSDLCSRLQPVPFCGVAYDKKELSSLIAGEAGSNTSRLHTTLPLYLHELWSLPERLDENISSLAVLQLQALPFLPVLVP